MSASRDAERRQSMLLLLQERARLLELPEAVMQRALERCSPLPALRPGLVPSAVSGVATVSEYPLGSVLVVESALLPTTSPPREPDATAAAPAPADQPVGEPSARTLADSLVHASSAVALGDDIPAGRIIAGYRIEGLLGRGGMGQVYRAIQLSVQRQVAFKVLSRRLAANPSFRERFLREARAAGRLHHHHLIAVHDVGEADGLMFFSMELVEGRTVKDLLRRGPLPVAQALDLAAQTLTALLYAHGHGVIHRDIKPDNLMVTAAGVVKVADLGLSRIDSGEPTSAASTQAGTLMGTPHYMSPEQGRDAHAVDHRSDLYAVGATLYHMLIGSPPFTGSSAVEVVMKAATAPLTFPEPGPPPALRALLSRLLAKRPEDRYASADEALVAVEQLRRGTLASARLATTPGSAGHEAVHRRQRAIRRRRLKRLLPGVLLAVLLVAACAATVVILHVQHGEDPAEHERSRVHALLATHAYREALSLVDADLADLPAESPLAREFTDLREHTQADWDAASAARVAPTLDAFATALRERRWADAEKDLHVDDEDSLSPLTRQQIETRREQLDQALSDTGDKTASHTAELVHRARDWRFATAWWSPVQAVPTAAVSAIDLGLAFHGAGMADLAYAADGPPRFAELWMRNGRELRGVDLKIQVLAPLEGQESWSLQVGAALIVVTAHGTTMTAEGFPATSLIGRVNIGVRLRRMGDELQLALAEGPWLRVGSIRQARLHLNWTLLPLHEVQVATHPVVEQVLARSTP